MAVISRRRMYFQNTLILICLAFGIGDTQALEIAEDDCGNEFLKKLTEANFGYTGENGTLPVTLNLKYLSNEGGSRTAKIKLSDYCPVPKIICEDEKIKINGETRYGPLLHCLWKWKPEDSTWNNVEIGLAESIGETLAISVVGRLSKEDDDVFPEAANKGPLDFKIITANGSGIVRRKRRSKPHRKVRSLSKRKIGKGRRNLGKLWTALMTN